MSIRHIPNSNDHRALMIAFNKVYDAIEASSGSAALNQPKVYNSSSASGSFSVASGSGESTYTLPDSSTSTKGGVYLSFAPIGNPIAVGDNDPRLDPTPVKLSGTTIVSDPSALDFVGTGVTVSNVGGVATVSIASGSGPLSVPFFKSNGIEHDIIANWVLGSAFLPFFKSNGTEQDIPLV